LKQRTPKLYFMPCREHIKVLQLTDSSDILENI
jgi:hypothetical protein